MIKLNGRIVVPTIFPDKTSQVWKVDLTPSTSGVWSIHWKYESEAELMHVCQLAHLISTRNVQKRQIHLFVDYLPYARQDKRVKNDQCFALHTFCGIIEQFIGKLITFDAHNPEFFKQYEWCIDYGNELPHMPKQLVELHSIDTIVFPDAGAASRYSHLSDKEIVSASKTRDQLTGQITGMTLPEFSGQRILVWDDICDGGRTFVELAKLLGPREFIMLYVSHGIFSKGTDCLLEAGYNAIWTKEGLVASK